MSDWTIRLLESPEDMEAVEALQRQVWPGSETDVVPAHVLLTIAHNGGLVIGAFVGERLVGMSLGFNGLDFTPDGPRPKHCSHMLGVLPEMRDSGIGFALKRSQWQMVRHQGLDHITWTYDPLLSRNAHLNIARLGAVSNTYLREVYGQMRDELNAGLPSDRLQVDWWVLTRRVEQRLGKQPRRTLGLAHFEKAGLQPLNPVALSSAGLPVPVAPASLPDEQMLLLEIPANFMALKREDAALGLEWRLLTRAVFEEAFARGYFVTDFVFDSSGERPRSFYVMTHGEAALSDLAVSK